MQGIMYFYFTYVGVLAYIKNYEKYTYERYKNSFKKVNQILNIFFTFFWWVFFTPFIEINSGIFVCGGNSFLVEYRDSKNCATKPIWMKLMSIIGLILTNLTGLIIIYFFRNYEFDEKNILKRRFNIILIP
jgi:hypothetical protein